MPTKEFTTPNIFVLVKSNQLSFSQMQGVTVLQNYRCKHCSACKILYIAHVQLAPSHRAGQHSFQQLVFVSNSQTCNAAITLTTQVTTEHMMSLST